MTISDDIFGMMLVVALLPFAILPWVLLYDYVRDLWHGER